MIGGIVNRLRNTGTLPAKQQHIARLKRKVEIGMLGMSREQHNPSTFGPHLGEKSVEARVSLNAHMLKII